ncbi:PAS domain-containing protein [Fundidesulfovibrio terrae]|uniref:PAS domain-containing protein n=1 Tax=Fundidesulfovibrio terrae TaxID=2922866 RepID=UPI001FAEDEBD|nr:PAS domain-containing protein [Fundidesulfovibrio terrae]
MDTGDFGFGGPRLPSFCLQTNHVEFARTHGELLNSVALPVAVLNGYWQIVFANRDFLRVFRSVPQEDILGSRVGEALGCSNASMSLSGCGTSPACRECDLAIALYVPCPDGRELPARKVRTGGDSLVELAEVACRFLDFDDGTLRICTFVDLTLR